MRSQLAFEARLACDHYAVLIKLRPVYDVTEAAYKIFGPISRYNPGSAHCFDIGVEGEITLSGQHTIELRMWAQAANATGLGNIDSNTSGVAEIFSEVRIWKM